MEGKTNISDLVLVAKLADSILIFVRKKDLSEHDPKALLYNARFKSYHISPLNKLLTLAAFEEVNQNDEILQNYFKNQITRIMPEDKLIQSITEFNHQILYGENYYIPHILKR